MTKFKSDFLRVLEARGFIQDVTEPEALDKLLASETVTAYIGFDATATSLHAGSLIPIMMLYWLQETGHKPSSSSVAVPPKWATHPARKKCARF